MNKIKVLAIIKGDSYDYMSDMLWIALSTDKDIEFKSNIYPMYFFKENKNKLKYPSIHTLYHKLDNSISDKDLDNKKLLEIIENKYHKWFLGVQFHPELKSKPFKPHPIFFSFIKNSLMNKNA